MIDEIALHRAELHELCRRFHVRQLDLFGSAARADFDLEHSDVDFIVEFECHTPLHPFDAYFGLKEELEALIGRRVDLVMPAAIRNPTARRAWSRIARPSMQRDACAFIWDAIKAAEAVQSFVRDRDYEAFLDDDLVRSAVERQLQIVGEALTQVAKLDPQCSARVPDLPRIVAFRNILVHGYAGIDYDTVWRLIQDKLPELLGTLRALLAEGSPPYAPAS